MHQAQQAHQRNHRVCEQDGEHQVELDQNRAVHWHRLQRDHYLASEQVVIKTYNRSNRDRLWTLHHQHLAAVARHKTV